MRKYKTTLKNDNEIITAAAEKSRFFCRLKTEMYYGEKFETVDEFVHCLEEYIHYYNNTRISLKLKGMSPVQYRTHSNTI